MGLNVAIVTDQATGRMIPGGYLAHPTLVPLKTSKPIADVYNAGSHYITFGLNGVDALTDAGVQVWDETTGQLTDAAVAEFGISPGDKALYWNTDLTVDFEIYQASQVEIADRLTAPTVTYQALTLLEQEHYLSITFQAGVLQVFTDPVTGQSTLGYPPDGVTEINVSVSLVQADGSTVVDAPPSDVHIGFYPDRGVVVTDRYQVGTLLSPALGFGAVFTWRFPADGGPVNLIARGLYSGTGPTVVQRTLSGYLLCLTEGAGRGSEADPTAAFP